MPKTRNSKLKKHDPLHQSIEESSGHLRRDEKSRHKRQSKDAVDDNGESYLDATSTRKILDIAREQQEEIEAEEREIANRFGLRPQDADLDDLDQDEEAEDAWSDAEQDEQDYGEIDWENMPEDADPEDLEVFSKYVEEQEGSGNNWADKIMDKVKEFESTGRIVIDQPGPSFDEDDEPEGVMLPPKVIEVYTQVGELLSRYRSGKLPRAFKIIPTLKNWRDILYVTFPEQWSNQAVYEATKLFIAGMPTHQAHRFVREILLPRFREQIKNDKAVNYHVYRALKKALFKPQAFFKGLLFPLLSDMEPTNREAIIIGSVLAKTSVPVLHSAAALLYVSEMPYSTANAVVIKTLLDKKYALPYKVVDAMVFHFVRFRSQKDPLPLVWHQSFLTFCQRYKNDITDDQREALMMVARVQTHHSITPEIRRELLAGEPRMD